MKRLLQPSSFAGYGLMTSGAHNLTHGHGWWGGCQIVCGLLAAVLDEAWIKR